MIINYINTFLIIFASSFVIHGLILTILKLGLLGNDLKNILNIILDKKIYLISLISFFIFISLYVYLNMQLIQLEPVKEVIIKANLGETEVNVSGSIFASLFNTAGSTAAFVLGARIAAGLLANKSVTLSTLSKTGSIIGFGAGSSLAYRVIHGTIPHNQVGDFKVKTGPVQISIENTTNPEVIFSKARELTNNILIKQNQLNLSTKLNVEGNKNVVIEGNKDISLTVTKELDKLDPNWRDNFTANSPLENGDIINPMLIENLHNNYLLHLIMLYLLIMLVIIFTCKLLIKENPEYPLIKRLPLGNFFHRIITLYISIWQKSSNIWIYSILFFLIIFNLAATYSIFNSVLYLKSIVS